jgi:hypothetical protein
MKIQVTVFWVVVLIQPVTQSSKSITLFFVSSNLSLFRYFLSLLVSREAYHQSPTSADVKNAWNFTSMPRTRPHIVVFMPSGKFI